MREGVRHGMSEGVRHWMSYAPVADTGEESREGSGGYFPRKLGKVHCYALPIGEEGGDGVSGFHRMAFQSRSMEGCADCRLAIVPLLCRFPYTNTAPHQSKRRRGPYKRTITYQIMA